MSNAFKWSLRIPLLAGILLAAASSAQAGIHIQIAPPDIRVETHPDRHGYVWQSGYWHWQGQRHEWVAGHYAREKNGQRWTDGRWDRNEQGYYWTTGRWEAEHQERR